MQDAYLVSAARTPIGRLLGGLSSVPAPQLAAVCLRGALERAGCDPGRIDEVILGNVIQAGVGQAPARQAALAAGVPPRVPALTVNKVCGSGLKAVMLAAQAIRAGDAHLVLAGGMENMSLAPHLVTNARHGWKFGHQTLLDSMLHDGLWCATEDVVMGELADSTAAAHGISREDQDAFAASSHQRAVEALEAGKFLPEIVPVSVPGRRGAVQEFSRDEGPRAESTAESLGRLRPAFNPDGSATPGNASQISDGAAALLVASGDAVRRLGLTPRARIVAYATSGVEPKDLFVAPVDAMKQVLERADLPASAMDLLEINEAFASQCLACMKPFDVDRDRVNIWGGAIALGHPIGASGARVLVTLLHALEDRQARRGLASLCLGGGNAVSMIIDRQI